MRVFRVLPLDRRTMQIEVFEEGRFRECSTGLMQGQMCHERTAVAADDGSTVLTDTLTYEPRGRLVDAVLRMGVTVTFRRRHRRLRLHSEKTAANPSERRIPRSRRQRCRGGQGDTIKQA